MGTMLNKLAGKRVLFIGPEFHDYHSLIIQKLNEAGVVVSFYPERKYNLIYKTINNFFPNYLPVYQARHYRQILSQSSEETFDYLFVIRGFKMPEDFVRTFKQKNPDAQTVMYQWDSNKTNPFSHLISAFDVIKSFDFEDCEKHKELQYLPLFYTDDVKHSFENIREGELYDYLFMGWYLPERYNAVVRFKNYIDAKGDNEKLKAFIYMPFTSYIKERMKGNFIDKSIVSFKHMPRKEYLENLNKSKVIVDVSNKNQTGLAMRIIEALACNKKVLTNNMHLKNDAFYSPEAIAFFNDENPNVSSEFLQRKVSQHIEMYSIEQWLINAFNL